MIIHFLLPWVGNRAPQRLSSCVIFLPCYGRSFENHVPNADGIGFSLFMGTASPLMIYLEMWHFILLSKFSFLSGKLLNEGICIMATLATYSVTEFLYTNIKPELLVHVTSQTMISWSFLPVLVFVNLFVNLHHLSSFGFTERNTLISASALVSCLRMKMKCSNPVPSDLFSGLACSLLLK